MIFRSERVRIQELATEAPAQEKIDLDAPYEYRREFSKSDRAHLRKEAEESRTNPDQLPFIRFAALLKYLDTPIGPPTEEQSQDIYFCMANSIATRNGVRFNSSWSLTALNGLLYDAQRFRDIAITQKTEEHAAIVRDLSSRPATDFPDWDDLAMLRLLNPKGVMPQVPDTIRKDLLEGVQDLLQEVTSGNINETNWEGLLESYAYARIFGLEDIDWKAVVPWRHMRKIIFEDPEVDVQRRAFDAFCARVLNADRMWVDEDGLHIEDPPLNEPDTKTRPRPPRIQV